jgi:hypothetical protein
MGGALQRRAKRRFAQARRTQAPNPTPGASALATRFEIRPEDALEQPAKARASRAELLRLVALSEQPIERELITGGRLRLRPAGRGRSLRADFGPLSSARCSRRSWESGGRMK